MHYRQLGTSGLRVSVIGLGTNQFGGPVDQAGVNDAIAAAQDLGINFIDSANGYQDGRSEAALGVALQGRWDRFVVATKVYMRTGDGPNDYGSSRYHIMQAVDDSLRRLQSDHIDLYQLHRWDPTTPIAETLRALDDLVCAGKVRYIGASAFTAWQLAEANMLADLRGWSRLVTVQSHYHLLERAVEKEVIPFCQSHGIGFIPYFPLAGGFLTGKYRRGEDPPAGTRAERSPYVREHMTDAKFDIIERLAVWAAAREHTLGELAHAWLLAQPAVCTVISGSTRLEQLQANAQAADWVLTADEVAEVDAIVGAAPDPGRAG